MPYEPRRTRSRTQNRVYDRTLQPRERFAGGNPTGTRSLPASSRESSTEPMDTDKGARTTREIAENIWRVQGRGRAGSVGHVPKDLTLPSAGGQENRRVRQRGVAEGSPRREATLRMGQDEGPSLLQIPLCVTAAYTVPLWQTPPMIWIGDQRMKEPGPRWNPGSVPRL